MRIDALKDLVQALINEDSALPVSRIVHALLRKSLKISQDTNGSSHPTLLPDDVTLLGLQLENLAAGESVLWEPQGAADLSRCIKHLYGHLAEEWHQRGFEAPEMRLRMVLEEAVLNGWKHGNRRASDLPLEVRWRFGNDFHLEVIDAGSGFNPMRQSDPTTPDNRQKTSGRGIFIMKHMADTLDWTDGGRRLKAAFYPQAQALGNQRSDGLNKMMNLWRSKQPDPKSAINSH